MPFIRIWVHLIWSTKNRQKVVTPDFKLLLLDHIRTNAKERNIRLDMINCVSDHVHSLLSLGAEQSISKVAMMLKGESSHWINSQNFLKSKFEWQDEYLAISVSESNAEIIRKYIQNQESHHKTKTFSEEYDELMKNYATKDHNM